MGVDVVLGAAGLSKTFRGTGSDIEVLDRPDSGEVLIGGRPIHDLKGKELDRLRNRVIGFIFQFHFLLPEFTAQENVMVPSLIQGENPRQAAERARRWLIKVGLEERLTHKPGELSGGEQQRVAVARALAGEPEVVLADEPTGNLDDETGEEINELIRTLAREEHKTFVVVTHKRGFAQYADRVLLLADRRLAHLE
jgi:lipoprotein-releasing system ATP-binding protein